MLVGSDGVSSKSAPIGFGFGLFLLDSNRIILPRIGSDLHRIRTMLSNKIETFESVISVPQKAYFNRFWVDKLPHRVLISNIWEHSLQYELLVLIHWRVQFHKALLACACSSKVILPQRCEQKLHYRRARSMYDEKRRRRLSCATESKSVPLSS